MSKYVCAILLLFAFGSCSKEKLKVRRLERQVESFKEEKEEVWKDSCMRSVSMSCYYADCAVTPIEVMQEKICGTIPEYL